MIRPARAASKADADTGVRSPSHHAKRAITTIRSASPTTVGRPRCPPLAGWLVTLTWLLLLVAPVRQNTISPTYLAVGLAQAQRPFCLCRATGESGHRPCWQYIHCLSIVVHPLSIHWLGPASHATRSLAAWQASSQTVAGPLVSGPIWVHRARHPRPAPPP